jgi:hypothetical protein
MSHVLTETSAKRSPNAVVEVSCRDGNIELNHGDTDAANAGVDEQCRKGRKVDGHMSIYTKVGDVAAYYCNNHGPANWCYDNVRQQYSALITDNCGWYVSGWGYDTGSHSTYGYRPKDDNFCPH